MAWAKSGEIIKTLRKQLGIDEKFFIIEKIWEKTVGIEDIELFGCKKEIIFAETSSSSANNEFLIRKKEIIKKINQYLDKKIKDIRVEIKER
jgi:hypothetical protein